MNKTKLCVFQFAWDKNREGKRTKNRGQNSTNEKKESKIKRYKMSTKK